FMLILTFASSTPVWSAFTRTFTFASTTRLTGTRTFIPSLLFGHGRRRTFVPRIPRLTTLSTVRRLRQLGQPCQLRAPIFRTGQAGAPQLWQDWQRSCLKKTQNTDLPALHFHTFTLLHFRRTALRCSAAQRF